MEIRWGLVSAALGLVVLSIFAFRNPHHFIHGRRSKFWVDLIGRENTLRLVKFVSVPLILLVALVLGLGGVGIIHLK